MEKYLEMTIARLREEAKIRGMKGVSAMKKQELAELLYAADSMLAQKQKESANKPESKNVKKSMTEKPEHNETADNSGATERKSGEERTNRVAERERPVGGSQVQYQGQDKQAVSRQPQATERQGGVRPQQSSERQAGIRPQQSSERQPGIKPQQGFERQPGIKPQQGFERQPGIKPQQNFERPNGARPQQAESKAQTTESTAESAPLPQRFDLEKATAEDIRRLDSGETREGILEVMSENFGFIRCDNYLPGENDVYVSPAQIRKYGLKTGDIICGNTKIRTQSEKFSALLYIKNVNGLPVEEIMKRKRFEDLTPIFPNERIHLETPGCSLSMRMVDLISPIGKGQRGMIVSQPKAGKTTLLKQIAKAITKNHPDMNMIILLIDERPEEVTDIKESIEGEKVEVIYSTFDELPENHKRVSEMVIERAKRLVEQKQDVVILLDSITRLARAYNLTIPASGRTLSGGLDPAALHMPKKFFGAARNMREGGSLTILATALVETGSRMDDVVFEEFKGTGNMELQLDRNLSERRVFPAIDLPRSSTRRDDLLLTKEEQEATSLMRRMFNGAKAEESLENIMRTFQSTKNNAEFVQMIKKFR